MTATANSDVIRIHRKSQVPALTRRGRVLLLGVPAMLLAAALLVAAVFAAAALFNQAQASTDSDAGLEAEVITVSEGDTLWSIASSAESGTDVQQLITQIAELNDLDSSQLAPGQELYVPVD
ncbi:LysM peptidoglycan-binding domain-containing protein [Nesterenkonia salmonea]|uniref:LysM peptidoglycan-binding domain-containing protein n=1 Tax=Nesterenkonia salmonea TaxID=1804987 RepID=A0A5R9BBA1_9MICC|nr:LysM peptidoglycan-binding domain-containing protein [Nesterenkonia salmonea]TLP96056.1 LysM peptidoglycan-binding domain-containing protein [Nesterenkonia salmonea]